jgi:hypothetical protein
MSKPIQILNQPLVFLLTFDFALLTQASYRSFLRTQYPELGTRIITKLLYSKTLYQAQALKLHFGAAAA